MTKAPHPDWVRGFFRLGSAHRFHVEDAAADDDQEQAEQRHTGEDVAQPLRVAWTPHAVTTLCAFANTRTGKDMSSA